MPTISRFYGIVIKMYFREHPPPHFHAEYGEHEAVIDVVSGAVISGQLPPRALRLVREWTSMHSDELRENWMMRVRAHEAPAAIEPLP